MEINVKIIFQLSGTNAVLQTNLWFQTEMAPGAPWVGPLALRSYWAPCLCEGMAIPAPRLSTKVCRNTNSWMSLTLLYVLILETLQIVHQPCSLVSLLLCRCITDKIKPFVCFAFSLTTYMARRLWMHSAEDSLPLWVFQMCFIYQECK